MRLSEKWADYQKVRLKKNKNSIILKMSLLRLLVDLDIPSNNCLSIIKSDYCFTID